MKLRRLSLRERAFFRGAKDDIPNVNPAQVLGLSQQHESSAMAESNEIPEHESPVRRMIADAHGMPFQPLRTLDDARRLDDGVAILEGDWGGQIYAVIPAHMICCPIEALQRLLLDLDAQAWSCNENEGASIFYERKPAGTRVGGGMGGGASTGELWVHPDFERIADQVRRVVLGEQESLNVR